MATVKELNALVVTLRAQLAEATERSANNARFADMWRHKYHALAKGTTPAAAGVVKYSGTPEENRAAMAAAKAAAIGGAA